MRAIKMKRTFSILPALLAVIPAHAAVAPHPETGDTNITLYALVSLMVILLFVIGVLGHTLIQLSSVVREKMRREKGEKSNNGAGIALLVLMFLLPLSSFGAEASAVSAAADVIDGIPATEFYVLMAFIILELLVIFALVIIIRVMLRLITGAINPEMPVVAKERKSWFWDKFNKAASVENEREILLDHNYDGIQELDNSLPPWWKYGFYLTIIVSFVYVYRFHVSHDGQSQLEEFAAEMQQGEEDKAAYLAMSANNVDESNVTLLTEGSALASGKELFVNNCAACHLADGGGSVGPNLTDDYWLHGGSLKDIFKSVKYGWQDKGMKSWKDDLSPVQMQQVVSFIKSLKGSHPVTPKAAQGDLYLEVKSEQVVAATDSVAGDK